MFAASPAPIMGGGLRPPPQRVGPPEAAHAFVDILILLVFLCIWGFGVESTYKKLHIISGKHAQELYVDFYMLPKASEKQWANLQPTSTVQLLLAP